MSIEFHAIDRQRRSQFRADLFSRLNQPTKPRLGKYTLNDLDEDFELCRFMTGDKFYCGDRVEAKSLCSDHHKMCWKVPS